MLDFNSSCHHTNNEVNPLLRDQGCKGKFSFVCSYIDVTAQAFFEMFQTFNHFASIQLGDSRLTA